MKLKVQLFLERGTSLYINGREPLTTNGWSCGTTDNDKGITCRTYQGDHLPFKEFTLDRLEFNIKGADTDWAWEDGRTPPWKRFKTITLYTSKGKFVLPVTATKTGDPDSEDDYEKVRIGRKKREITECTLYVEGEANVD
jgi:hypothetical protein